MMVRDIKETNNIEQQTDSKINETNYKANSDITEDHINQFGQA